MKTYFVLINFLYLLGFFQDIFPSSRIAIVSLYDENFKELGKYSDLNKQRYAEKHGYDLFLYHSLLDKKRPASWSKIKALEKHLNNYDWLFWVDADALIMNDSIKLESLIDTKFNFIIAQQERSKHTNCGVFFIRNSDWSKRLLKDIYAQKQFINHKNWEQAAFHYLLNRNYNNCKKHVKIVRQRVMNSAYWREGIYQPGDFIIHFYGIANKDRAPLMKEFYEKTLNTN